MAYTVLARRYRSATFDDLIGQGHVARTLTNAINTNRLAHAFLFTGTRGTGKTSSARILAKSLNCEASDKPTPKPCGKCNSCQAIARGDDIDVIEIDAASNTGVDNVREIIENSQFRPARSRFKVYIIDEVHMLSKSAFNALLKTLEEPPEHVKFILATTEVEKVLPTILSRCQRYDFRNIPTREIAAHLKSVCKQEKIKADDDAILLVAKSGAGSMRDALSLLDRLLSAAGDHLTTGTIEELLGLPRSGQIFDLTNSIGAGDVKDVLTKVDTLITGGLSPEMLTSSLVDHLRNLLILRTCGKQSELVEVPGLSLNDLDGQAQKFDPVVLTQDIVILEELRRQLRQSTAGRALIDATMVRLALAEQFSTIEDLIGGVDGSSANGAAGAAKKKYLPAEQVISNEGQGASKPAFSPEPPATTGDSLSRQTRPAPAEAEAPSQASAPAPEPVAEASAPASTTDEKDELPAVGRVWEGAGPTSVFAAFKKAGGPPKPPPQQHVEAPVSNVGPVDRSDLNNLLARFRAAAAQEAPTVAGFLDGSRPIALEGSALSLEYPKSREMSVKMLDRNGKRESLAGVLSNLLGEPASIRVSVNESLVEEPTPAPDAATQRAAWKPASAPTKAPPPEPAAPVNNGIPLTEELRVELLTKNPLIKSLAEQLNARIVKVEEE